MKPLSPEAFEEVKDIVAEVTLYEENLLAFAAELRALRSLHRLAKREHRLPIALIRAINSLPEVADTMAWKRLIGDSRAAALGAGAPDLATLGKR